MCQSIFSKLPTSTLKSLYPPPSSSTQKITTALEENTQLCSKGNCGFFGNPATINLCSKCYKDFSLSEMLKSLTINTSAHEPNKKHNKASGFAQTETATTAIQSCGCCNKRLRLAFRFKCRCGSMYFVTHRFPEDQGCQFDDKAIGRDSIAKYNTLAKDHKLERV